jgi:hypothetical protein
MDEIANIELGVAAAWLQKDLHECLSEMAPQVLVQVRKPSMQEAEEDAVIAADITAFTDRLDPLLDALLADYRLLACLDSEDGAKRVLLFLPPGARSSTGRYPPIFLARLLPIGSQWQERWASPIVGGRQTS